MAAYLGQHGPRRLRQYNCPRRIVTTILSRAGNGHFLITPHVQRVALTLVSSEQSLIHVTPMTSQEAFPLLQTIIPKDSPTKSDAIELANVLDCLPLETKRAICYISAIDTSINGYLRLFLKD